MLVATEITTHHLPPPQRLLQPPYPAHVGAELFGLQCEVDGELREVLREEVGVRGVELGVEVHGVVHAEDAAACSGRGREWR